MIQQGVSAGGVDDDAVTVGRIMDFVEARLDAVKAREEEEDEEEEREGSGSSSAHHNPGKAAPVVAKPKAHKEPVIVGLATPNSPQSRSVQHLPAHPPTPSPSSSRPVSSGTHQRRPRKESPPTALPLPIAMPLSDSGPHLTITNTHRDNHSEAITTGAKRRHAVMMMLDSSPSELHGPPSPQTSMQNGRRRTRSTRGGGFGGLLAASDAMEVEEENGRERKRITRR